MFSFVALTCNYNNEVFTLTDGDAAVEDMPELSDGDDDADEDEEQWQWMEEDNQPVTCLFCDR